MIRRPRVPVLVHVVGARPNFMKVAPLLRLLEEERSFRNLLVHTGQHYDPEMSGRFFEELGIRAPDRNLGVGSASHAVQTAEVMKRFDTFLDEEEADLVVVVGDVNSTLAATLVAAKRGVPVAHVEAGLRSRDRTMPEELNRLLTDQLAELLFTPSADADENLRAEGVPDSRIHRVGNIMVDTLLHSLEAARTRGALAEHAPGGGTAPYGLVTLHRPGNVDDPAVLREIFLALDEIAEEIPLLFAVHPRTRARAEEYGLELDRVEVVPPLGYLDLLALQEKATIVITDSGGIQEETTALGVPCLTLRPTTERPVTILEGTNRLVPDRSRSAIVSSVREVLADPPTGRIPELWDGRTAERIVGVLESTLKSLSE